MEHILLNSSVERNMYLTHLTAGFDAHIADPESLIQVTQLSQVLGTSSPSARMYAATGKALLKKLQKKSTFTRTDILQL